MPKPAFRFEAFYGVDGCRGGWFFFGIGLKEQTCFGVVESIAERIEAEKENSLFLVDIPIGLPFSGHPSRRCDIEARRLLSPLRHSSVFSPPCREALTAEDYRQACRINRKITGKMISQQAYRIGAKIREMDDLLQRKPELSSMIREAHPEVCFHSMAGGSPMRHNKRSAEGFAERFTLIQRYLPDAETSLHRALERYRRKGVGRDDIVDAMAIAVIGKISKGCLQTLPETPDTDESGLPMEIVRMVSA